MRRKSVFSKWTLVLTVVLLCPYVFSRPQDATSDSDSTPLDKPTENPIRYRYRNDSINSRQTLPVVTNIYVSQSEYITNNITKLLPTPYPIRNRVNNSSNTNRISRFLNNNSKNKNHKNISHSFQTNRPTDRIPTKNYKKLEIKKVITKWRDDTKYEDLDFSYETTLSNEVDIKKFAFDDDTEELSSTENTNDFSTEVSKKNTHRIRKPIKQLINKIKHKIHHRPKPQQQYEEHVQSENYVTAGYSYPNTRPVYVFNTPTPTPIITNVGNPRPWLKPNFQVVYQNPTTPRPIMVTRPLKNQHNYHTPVYNDNPQYPGHEFEVTTFQPTNGYTDRIVIRPEEYAASPDECPTIFLTLNNTFQGQGKEACPDLNIAVNTNVVNKNVVVESDEEDGDDLFPDGFGLPFDESGDETGHEDHSYNSDENQEQVESASIEGQALTNYNAASDAESAEPGGSSSSAPQVVAEIKKEEPYKPIEISTTATSTSETSRDVKTKGPVIRDSIKMVANQLLNKPSNASADAPIVPDTRIPPKLKNQLAHKQKIKTRNDDGNELTENAHAGVAVPVSMEELETENKISESSTTNEGISTWILLSNPSNSNDTVSTEPTKVEDSQKKQKPVVFKNKTKRPQINKVSTGKRPILGSTNKSDLVASGSAINENVYNKIKDTVLTNVQKNKSTPTQRTTTVTTTTTTTTTTEAPTTAKKEPVTKAPAAIIPVIKLASKPSKKKNKNKQKTTTTQAPAIQESALLPMEPKEQEIELEVSTPATTTKKPKRSSTKKKNKTKKRKTSKPKPEAETAVTEIKTTTNKTKSAKPAKKPSTQTGPLTTQIYNYFSREVMPSVGVGVIGLASLVGLASYFLYPFSTPVRRTFEVDKKDDLYRNNAEEYANEGNGQAEEEMLGTVLAGMPAHSKQKLNPYAGQTHVNVNRYPVKKEQDIRYRHVVTPSYEPNYNVHYPQQKTGLAHGAVYPKPINYGPQQYEYETRNVYTTESKYVYDKSPQIGYTPYPAVEPIYAAPQTGPSAVSSYGSDASNSVVYGVKPSADTDFRPVYPFEGKIFSETTGNPITYPPTSMFLGNNEDQESEDTKYDENSNTSPDVVDNKFVVGNVPKELVESATPAVVPEHGPRNLRKRRNAVFRKRAISGSIEEMLKEANKDVFISNEIDETPGLLVRNLAEATDPEPIKNDMPTTPEATKEVYTVYAMSVDPTKDEKSATEGTPAAQDVIIENVSTLPINNDKTTETDMANDLDVTTKAFRVYEVFTNGPTESEKLQTEKDGSVKVDTTTQFKNMMTETTTEFKSETTSTMPPSPSSVSETKLTTKRPRPTLHPEVITYPPLNQEGGFFSFLKRLVEFKYRLGLSILQTTSDNLNRYLRSMEDSVQKVAKASH